MEIIIVLDFPEEKVSCLNWKMSESTFPERKVEQKQDRHEIPLEVSEEPLWKLANEKILESIQTLTETVSPITFLKV